MRDLRTADSASGDFDQNLARGRRQLRLDQLEFSRLYQPGPDSLHAITTEIFR